MAMFFQQYDPNRNPEIPASFPTAAPDVAMPAPQQSRGGLFGGGFARALRSVGGAAKDAVLGGEPGRSPNIFDFILGGFGPSGAMGRVDTIRQGAIADRDRRALSDALASSRGISDPTERMNAMFDRLPPDMQAQLLQSRQSRQQQLEDTSGEREFETGQTRLKSELEGGQLDRRFAFEGREGALDRASRERVAGISAARGRNDLTAQEGARLNSAVEAANQAREMRALLSEASGLSTRVATGPGQAFAPGFVRSPEAQRFDQIAKRLTSLSRMAGTGAESDRDAARMEASTLGMTQWGPANQMYIAAQMERVKNIEDRANFLDEYSTSGSLQNAERAWAQYLRANPIFDRSGSVRTDRPNLDEWLNLGGPDMSEEASPGSRIRERPLSEFGEPVEGRVDQRTRGGLSSRQYGGFGRD